MDFIVGRYVEPWKPKIIFIYFENQRSYTKINTFCYGNKVKDKKMKITIVILSSENASFKHNLEPFLLLFVGNMPNFCIIYIQALFTILKLPLLRKYVELRILNRNSSLFKTSQQRHYLSILH